jgi:hypothetical protein
VIVVILFLATGFAQHRIFAVLFNQFVFKPGFIRTGEDIFFGMNYRSQWSNVGLPFSTFQFSFIKPLVKPGVHVKHLGGLGASFLNDVAGPNDEFTHKAVMLSEHTIFN